MALVKETPKSMTEGQKPQTPELSGRAPAPSAPATASPFAYVRRFAEEMDRLFEEFGVGTGIHMPSFLTRGHELLRRETGLVPADWSPRVDIVRQDGKFIVHADLPGLAKDEIKVDVTDDSLTIQGERKQEVKKTAEGYSYNECTYGSFYRCIPLPEGVDTSRATADFHNGVLEISMPMAPHTPPQSRRLEVREDK